MQIDRKRRWELQRKRLATGHKPDDREEQVFEYNRKTIYISEASATLHEFGHFLDWQLGFPTEHEQLYLAEAQTSGLRDYAKTNAGEYFADCFSYYITYGSNSEMMKTLRKNAPQTCTYFEELGKGGWSRDIHAK